MKKNRRYEDKRQAAINENNRYFSRLMIFMVAMYAVIYLALDYFLL